jgi:hypothetical protein
MATFEVEAPDGSVFEVEAPDYATQNQVLRFAASQFKQQPQEVEQPPLETGQAVTESLTRGATIGASDFLVPALGAAFAKAAGVEDKTFGQLFEEARGDVTGRREQLREESPVIAATTEIAGSLPTGGALFKGAQTAARGANLGRAATPTALSATGAVEAAGLGEKESTEQILRNAVTGAVLAPVSAKVFEKATPFIASKVSNFADGVAQPVKKIAESLFKVNPVVVKNFTESGVKPSLLAVTGSPTIKRVGSILKGTLGSTSVITNNIDETLVGIERGVEKLSKQQGAVTGQQAGEVIQEGIRGFVDKFQDVSKKLYTRLGRYIKPDDVGDVANAKNLFNSEIAKFSGQPNLQASRQSNAAFRKLQDIAGDAADGGLPYNALEAYRTDVGSLIKQNTITGQDNALAKRVYSALSDDMRTLAESKGPAAIKAFDNANDFYREGIDKIEKRLIKYIGKDSDPGLIFNQLKSSTKVGDVKASKLLNAVPKKDRGLVRDAVVQQMGRSRDGEFSVARFVSDYGNITPEGKNIIFGKAGGQYRKSLDKLADVSRTLRDSQEFTNTSRTADNLGNIGLLALGAVDPGTAIATGAGANVSARLLTNEGFVKTLAKAADQPINRGTFRTTLKRLEEVAVNNPAIKDDISQYVGILGAYMGQAMGGDE